MNDLGITFDGYKVIGINYSIINGLLYKTIEYLMDEGGELKTKYITYKINGEIIK